ncbi:MAG: hypothetical protein Kow0077_22110 [Anaerolineae bacterium]
MNLHDYDTFSAELQATLEQDSRVLGLVAAGSMANTNHAPDAYSDHDFWIITRPGAQEHFRTTYDWLPYHERIILAFRETEHGLKLFFDFGHLVEYAVFAPEELSVTRLNSYRVLIDRERIAERLQEVLERTAQESAAEQDNSTFLFGQFLTNLWVGVGRHRRGEWLSGHQFVRHSALNHLLPLLKRWVPAQRPDRLDNIDHTRRFEQAYPALGQDLRRALLLDTPEAADALLTLAAVELGRTWPDYPTEAVHCVAHHLLQTDDSPPPVESIEWPI